MQWGTSISGSPLISAVSFSGIGAKGGRVCHPLVRIFFCPAIIYSSIFWCQMRVTVGSEAHKLSRFTWDFSLPRGGGWGAQWTCRQQFCTAYPRLDHISVTSSIRRFRVSDKLRKFMYPRIREHAQPSAAVHILKELLICEKFTNFGVTCEKDANFVHFLRASENAAK